MIDETTYVKREWLVTNCMGGFASGTVAGALTRRYHGILVASLPAPLGRTVLLNHIWEEVSIDDGRCFVLGTSDYSREGAFAGVARLKTFALVEGLPLWTYDIEGMILEKRIMMPRLQNTTYVTYTLRNSSSPIRLRLHTSVHFRNYEEPVDARLEHQYSITIVDRRCDIGSEGFPPLRMRLDGGHDAELRVAPTSGEDLRYRMEHDRGYAGVGRLWSPGAYEVTLPPGETCTLIASAEPWDIVDALPPAAAFAAEHERRNGLISLAHAHPDVGAVMDSADGETVRRLLFAADQFIITPTGRAQDRARAEAAGDEVRTVIAGYHWFTDWGRDTMISLEGLTLSTGRWREAGYILRTFAYYVRDGLIPNMFPDKGTEGLYHTADATLWFFHALHRYLVVTDDSHMRDHMLPVMRNIADCHLRGTRFGIHVDTTDGLLTQGADGYQLTWMDALVDGWVVTPRRGKAVEINALWYNALMLLAGWLRDAGDEAGANTYATHADRARVSFNARFWNEKTQCLFDVIDGPEGNDAKCRPNQMFAISLDHPVLDQQRWATVMEKIRSELLTPYGLRSLSPRDAEYKKNYHGDLRTRDAAYHQGTVWAWLIGPFIDAWLRVQPGDFIAARHSLDALIAHLDEYGVGSIAEIFDAEPPFHPRGCIAQAWSVSEVLRSLLRADASATSPADGDQALVAQRLTTMS